MVLSTLTKGYAGDAKALLTHRGIARAPGRLLCLKGDDETVRGFPFDPYDSADRRSGIWVRSSEQDSGVFEGLVAWKVGGDEMRGFGWLRRFWRGLTEGFRRGMKAKG
jgi:hypothetical protein